MSRQVDRLLAQLATDSGQPVHEYVPAGRRPTSAASGRGAASRAAPLRAAPPGGSTAALWARLTLGVALGAAITQWPYAHGCGLPLVAYLGAAAMVLLAAVWIASLSWRQRRAGAHVVALALFCWGMVLAAQQVLPRVGYAAQHASWRCTPPSS